MATCEMCGSVVDSTKTIKVAGTNMQACNNCKHMGKPVEFEQNSNYTHTFRKNKKTQTSQEVIPNFASVLTKTAAKKELNIHQIAKTLNIKESTLTQYFSGKIKPDIQTAKTLSRFLEISLTQEVETINTKEYLQEEESKESGNESLSLGDMLLKQMQKKEK